MEHPDVNSGLTGDVWKSMSEEAQAAYSNRNRWLWAFVRAVAPGAQGSLDEHLQRALARAQHLYQMDIRPREGG